MSEADAPEPGRRERLLSRFRKAEERWNVVMDTFGRCTFAERLVTGCCERHYLCHHPEQEGKVYEPRRCSSLCPHYRPKGEA